MSQENFHGNRSLDECLETYYDDESQHDLHARLAAEQQAQFRLQLLLVWQWLKKNLGSR